MERANPAVATIADGENTISSSRKSPTRVFRRTIGCLFRGRFLLGSAQLLSENGITFEVSGLDPKLVLGQAKAVISFFLPKEGGISIMGDMAHISGSQFELKFIDLPLAQRREVRKYVSLKSEEET